MVTGGMLYGLSGDQRLHRRALGVSGSAGNWTTTADEGEGNGWCRWPNKAPF